MESPAHNVKIPTRNLEWRQRGNLKTIANVNCKQLQGVQGWWHRHPDASVHRRFMQGCNIANTRILLAAPMAKTWF
jgi:hypothetical protein